MYLLFCQISLISFIIETKSSSTEMVSITFIHKRFSVCWVEAFSTQHNPVLGCRPPSISEDEKSLPRETRAKLSQLRSDWSRFLRAYLHKIGEATSDACPLCRSGPQNTRHLFCCPATPTSLKAEYLWSKPAEVAAFLDLKT